jgi:hypothetical protein
MQSLLNAPWGALILVGALVVGLMFLCRDGHHDGYDSGTQDPGNDSFD